MREEGQQEGTDQPYSDEHGLAGTVAGLGDPSKATVASVLVEEARDGSSYDVDEISEAEARAIMERAVSHCLRLALSLLDPGGDGCADLNGAADRAEPVMRFLRHVGQHATGSIALLAARSEERRVG